MTSYRDPAWGPLVHTDMPTAAQEAVLLSDFYWVERLTLALQKIDSAHTTFHLAQVMGVADPEDNDRCERLVELEEQGMHMLERARSSVWN